MKKSPFVTLTVVTLLAFSAFACLKERKLPTYFPEKISANGKDTTFYQIPSFALTNQDGKAVSERDFAGKIWVVDFFFTYCPSICPAKTNNLQAVQTAFGDNPNVQILSISLDPLRDSVPELRAYAEKHHAAGNNRWQFLKAGSIPQVENLSHKVFRLAYTRDAAAEMGINHDPRLVLVDKDRHIRGYYTGTDPEEVKRLIGDIKRLLE